MKIEADMSNPQFRQIVEATVGMAIEEYRNQVERPTLRDQFAMSALTGLLANDGEWQERAAECAYLIADAMMKARE